MNGGYHLPEMSHPLGNGGPPGYPNHQLPSMAPYHPQQPQPHPQLPPVSHAHPPLPQHQHQHQHQQPPPPPLQHQILHQLPHPPPPQLPNPHQQPPPPSRHENGTHLPPTSSSTDQHTRPEQMPPAFSKVDMHSNRKYELDVVQQPRRARMCGFGDKDRRPITPPPCVRLVITDMSLLKEVDVNEIDFSMFVLNVDLWNEDGTQEVNLVRSSTGTPSISSTTPYSYTTAINVNTSNPPAYHQSLPPPPSRDSAYGQSSGMPYDYTNQQQSYGQVSSSYPANGSYGPPQQYFPQAGGYRPEPALPSQAGMAQSGYQQDQSAMARMSVVGGQPQGMFTRNLIGSLAASAFRLHDTQEKIGIWFVLQDLSVRTEGPFRLRFSFVNVAAPNRDGGAPIVNRGKAPILASCFSEVFHVFSAKKFPGVCESTPLSKTFAAQGIKIPIRKDSNLKGDNDDDEY